MAHEWFDRKYHDGGKPSLEDKAQLFGDIEILLPERAKENIKTRMKSAIHELYREYTPSNHIIAHNLLLCFAPLIKMDQLEYKEQMDKYKQALKKHADKLAFKENFQR
jgi:hypothetical protein